MIFTLKLIMNRDNLTSFFEHVNIQHLMNNVLQIFQKISVHVILSESILYFHVFTDL
jgi:hypothetical protein